MILFIYCFFFEAALSVCVSRLRSFQNMAELEFVRTKTVVSDFSDQNIINLRCCSNLYGLRSLRFLCEE